MSRETKDEEKARLMREILEKRKNSQTTDQEPITLTTGSGQKTEPESSSSALASMLNSAADTTNDMLRYADDAFAQLRKVLNGQQKELDELSRQNGLSAKPGYTSKDMEQMQKDMQEEYHLSNEEVNARMPVKNLDSEKVFTEIYHELDAAVVGQDDALHAACAAFRRPYVMGEEPGKPKNVILVTGPVGSGRHTMIRQMAESMYQHQAIESNEVRTLDLSLYTGSAQEPIFLQDLYQSLSSKSAIICFENFESAYPKFRDYVRALAVDGKCILTKRYVLNKGILVETQTGLVKKAIDSFSAEGKYLVFLTTRGVKAAQDAFGADFLYHVLDIISFTAMTEVDAKEYVSLCLKNLTDKAKKNLKLSLTAEDSFGEWVIAHYDKSRGADAIMGMFEDYYISLSEASLSGKYPGESAVLTIRDDAPAALISGKAAKLSRSKTSSEEIAAVNKELDAIVGLEPIKEYIRSLQAHLQVQELRRQQGLKTSEVSKHMIFTGNPGTGKTTIARLISRYMKAIGALSQGQLVEVTRKDLVAQYVGQTAPQTMSVIRSALGGVLFIDEAYSLYRGKDDSFGLEAIDTIVKAMEDNRENLIVILAGYKKEMSTFLEANSGLRSRFPNIIDFPDYTGEELLKIAEIQADSKGFTITEDARQPLLDFFNEVQSINAAEAGNGRLARNTVEKAILKQSERLVKHQGDNLSELRKEDFDFTINVKPSEETESF